MRFLIILCLLLLNFRFGYTQEIGTIEKAECFLEDCQFLENYPDTEFGYLTVPENYDKPEGKKIKIAFSILKTSNEKFKDDPIIVFAGGWGVPEVNSTAAYTRMPFLQERDIILFDYRGSGFSTKLPCENLGVDAWKDLFSDISYETFNQRQTKRYEDCVDGMIADGIDINQYGMKTIARDAVFLAQQLDYTDYNLFGISYGTMGIQHFLRAAPLYDINVRAAMLDSNVPIGQPTQGSMATIYAESITNLFEDCAKDPECEKAFPNLQERYLNFLDEVDQEDLKFPTTDGKTASLNREEINSIIHQTLYNSSLYGEFPQLIEAFINRDILVIQRIAEGMQSRVETSYNALGIVEYVQDHKGSIDISRKIFEVQQKNLKAYSVVDSYLDFYFNNTTIPVDSVAMTPVQTNVPSLLLAGTYDPITPPRWNDDFRKNFSNHYYYVYPKVGHGVVMTPCGTKMVKAFFDDPSQDPKVDCFEEAQSKEINFTSSYYKNSKLGNLVINLQQIKPLWVIIIIAITFLVALVNIILSMIRFRRKKTSYTIIKFIASLLAVVMISGLVFYIIQTVQTSRFLMLFGLVSGAKLISYLVPIFWLVTAVYLYKCQKEKPRVVWDIITALVYIGLCAVTIVYKIFPVF